MTTEESVVDLCTDLKDYLKETFMNGDAIKENGDKMCVSHYEQYLKKLSTPPMFTTIRFNNLKVTFPAILKDIQTELNEQFQAKMCSTPKCVPHSRLPDTLVIPNTGPYKLDQHPIEVIVDNLCGMSVMRGANVFAQGILAAPSFMKAGDTVSVYIDVDGKCRKGLTQTFSGVRRHIGNGIARVSRHQLFVNEIKCEGVGVEMTNSLYVAPSLNNILSDLIFAQNLPSIVCSYVLDPKPGEIILDMCAAPGGKTMHIATLMQNQGRVVAFDKNEGKINKIKQNALKWDLSSIEAFVQDGRKSLDENSNKCGSPPYPQETFDRILLDAPCSALGQRPTIKNKMKLKEVKSYPVLQRQLFEKAVKLLKFGGVLLYSTCSIPLEENEMQVKWALDNFSCLSLEPQTPHLGSTGLPGAGLLPHQRSLVQRFDPVKSIDYPSVDTDTIGFFIAKFVKK